MGSFSLVQAVAFQPGAHFGFEHVLHVLVVLLKYLDVELQTKSHTDTHFVSSGFAGQATHSLSLVSHGTHVGVA